MDWLNQEAQASSVVDRTARAQGHLEPLLVVPANEGVQGLDELLDLRRLPVTRIEPFGLKLTEEAVACLTAFGACAQRHLSRSGRDELVIDFSSLPLGGLPCLPANMSSGSYEGYLCVIPGAALADIYDKHGSRLLEGNVRAFLSTTGKINKGIQQTLQREPEMFFAYNNGISATASSVSIDDTAHGQRIVSAADFQIVNGGANDGVDVLRQA